MLENVKDFKVCSTVDLYNYLPVTIINYYIGKSTDIVTSGKKNTFSISIADKKYLNKSNKFYRLLIEVEKIKKLFKSELLDIEFAIDSKKESIHLTSEANYYSKNKKLFQRSSILKI